MNRETIKALELSRLLDIVGRYAVSPLGKRAFERFAGDPLFSEPEGARESLAEVSEAMDWLREAEAHVGHRDERPLPGFDGLRDVRDALTRMEVRGTVLEGPDIRSLLELLERCSETRARLSAVTTTHPRLGGFAEDLGEFRPLLKQLAGKILPNGEPADDASPGLARVRGKIERHRSLVRKSLEKFVRTLEEQGSLRDDYVTIRNGRLVVPVKAEWKWRVEGVIHTASSTGQTVFIEPVATLDLNNRLVKLLEDEKRETHRILRQITARLREEAGAIELAVRTLAGLELIFTKARFGRHFRCSIPAFAGDSERRLALSGARHPLLEEVLRGTESEVVPLRLKLDTENRVVIISGPNAGGKTIVLKTVGLLSLMAQAGLPIPAVEAELPWFENIEADIGDAQSIAESLSTFSAHIARIREMITAATADSLVLLDELGAATDPEEGGALGIAVVDHFRDRGAFTIASTHLPALKTYAAATEGVENASVGFDEETLRPNYRFSPGNPGQSASLAMAERFGLPASIIERAHQALDPEQRQTARFLRHLHQQVEQSEAATRELREAERLLRDRESNLAREWESREKAKLRELEQKVDQHLARFEIDHQKALDELAQSGAKRRALTEAQRRAAKRKRELREDVRSTVDASLGRSTANAEPAEEPRVVEIGARVRLVDLGVTGHVTAKISGALWEVAAGQLKVRVSERDIAVIPAGSDSSTPSSSYGSLPRGVTFRGQRRDASTLSEINVIGSRADEARDAVDKFLDDAVLAEIDRVRVIHGYGKEILRRELWRMFAAHPQVARYYQAEQVEGGAGATIVEVKL